MNREELEQLTKEDGKIVEIDGEYYFQFNAPVETIEFTVDLNKEEN